MARMVTYAEAAPSGGVHLITQVGWRRGVLQKWMKTPRDHVLKHQQAPKTLLKVPPWDPSAALTPAVLDSLLNPVTMFPPECNGILMRAALCSNMLKFTPLTILLTQ